MQFAFRYNIILRKPIGTKRTDLGSAVEDTEDIPTQAALVSSASRETDNTNVILPEHNRQFIIRERPDINTGWTLVYQNHIHNILAIDPIISRDRNNFIKLICKATETTHTQHVIPDTSDKPVFYFGFAGIPGPPSSTHTYNVANAGSVLTQPPTAGVSLPIAIPTPTMGRNIVILYPTGFGNPSAYYAGSDTALNQIGAFYFANAIIEGSATPIANPNAYTALISRNKKLTDTPVNDNLVW